MPLNRPFYTDGTYRSKLSYVRIFRKCSSGTVLLNSYEFLSNGVKREKSYESHVLLRLNARLLLLFTSMQHKTVQMLLRILKLYQ